MSRCPDCGQKDCCGANMANEIDALRAELAASQAREAQMREFIKSADVSSGVCCCGDNMEGHADPMTCGHSPLDMWDYAITQFNSATNDTTALDARLRAERAKERERIVALFFDKIRAMGDE